MQSFFDSEQGIMDWQTAISNHPELGSALESCLETLEMSLDDSPQLLLMFVSSQHHGSWSLLGPVLTKRFPGSQVVGCSCAGVVGGGHEVEQGPALVIAACDMPGVEFETIYIGSEESNVDAAIAELAAHPETPEGLLLLPDPYTTDVHRLLSEVDNVCPDTAVFGGMASGGREAGDHALFINEKVYRAGCVGVAFRGNVAIQCLISQGCRPIGDPLFVTRSRGHTVFELDGMPALHAVEHVCKGLFPDDLTLARKALYMGVAVDEGALVYKGGDFLVRDIIGAMPEGKALVVAARVPEKTVVQFHVRDARSAWAELDKLLEEAASDERKPTAALMFSCVGRGQRLFGEPGHDSRVIRQHFGDLSVAGFFGNGEIGPVGHRTWIHGYTTALILFKPAGDA